MSERTAKTLLLGVEHLCFAWFTLCVAMAPAFADDGGSREEDVGVGVGVVIGSVAGGPFGAIVGAALGAKLGDEFHQRNEDVNSLTASLSGSTDRISDLELNISALQGEVHTRDDELQQIREIVRPELVAMLKAGIEMDLLFRTDEHVLADVTSKRLEQLASSLAINPNIRVQLDGYADERGDESYNQDLSARRVSYVRDVLVKAGVPADRISLDAHGESTAVEQNSDSFALERRVSLTLFVGETPSFAANPR